MHVRLAMIVIGASLLLGGCATTGTSGETGASRNVISGEQIDGYEGHSVLLLVQSLRPAWLRTRGTSSLMLSDAVQVYVNGMSWGTVRTLDSLHPRDVLEIRRLSSREATARFGTGHPNGAILVTMK